MEQLKLAVLFPALLALLTSETGWAFGPNRVPMFSPVHYNHHRSACTPVWLAKGDSLREATGIRPSLHPTTINAIADALKTRARKTEDMNFRPTETVRPIDVALTAGKIASAAIKTRQKTSDEDGMKFTPKEEQTIAGRILGVIMRFDDLESKLYEKVSGVSWVEKYNEWSTFGILITEEEVDFVDERIRQDPLFALSRAECLLAIFLETVEIPQLQKAGETVPDGSKIDFMDADRMEVLLSERSQ